MPLFSMREHPIPTVTDPQQYRAIGLVRGVYSPEDPELISRGQLIDSDGVVVQAVVLGRVMTLMHRHLQMDKPHLWVVYPRCRDTTFLHLQIVGIWEPSTLSIDSDNNKFLEENNQSIDFVDELPEGDDYFSIRGELIYTKPDTSDFVVKIRQRQRPNGPRPVPFKLQLKGKIPLDKLRHFLSLDVRRHGQELCLENYQVIAPMPTRGGKKHGGRSAVTKRSSPEKR